MSDPVFHGTTGKTFRSVNVTKVNVTKVICILAYLFTIIALFIILFSPARGYELSIYTSSPLAMWFFLISSTAGSILIIIWLSSSGRFNTVYLLSSFLLLLNNFIILSLPALRGYFQYAAGDPISHLSEIQSIVSNGYMGEHNIYPLLHIIYVALSELSGQSANILSRYTPPLFSLIFLMLFMVLLAKVSLPKSVPISLVLPATTVLYFNSLHFLVYPHVFSILLLPMAFYIFFKCSHSNAWQWTLLSVLLLIAVPFTHPTGGTIVIVTLCISAIALKVLRDRMHLSNNRKSFLKQLLIPLVVLFTWHSNFGIFNNKVAGFFSTFFQVSNDPHITYFVQIADRLTFMENLTFVLRMYGDTLIFCVLSIASTIFIFKSIMRKDKDYANLLVLVIFFYYGFLIQGIIFSAVGSVTVGRMLNLPCSMVVTPILVGFGLYALFQGLSKERASFLISSILIVVFVVSLLSVFHSPWTFSPSWHITNMDNSGSSWIADYRDATLNFEAMGLDSSLLGGSTEVIPQGFSYDSPLGNAINDDNYLLINKRCIMANTNLMVAKAKLNVKHGWGFGLTEYTKIDSDYSINRIYSNGEFDSYLVSDLIERRR
ncbi:MAG: hypothetical protein ACOYCB_10440 [Fastidiosipilaceae bacterium]|jgi:hypothetical protein